MSAEADDGRAPGREGAGEDSDRDVLARVRGDDFHPIARRRRPSARSLEGHETTLTGLVELPVPVADDSAGVAHGRQDNALRNPCQGRILTRLRHGAARLTCRAMSAHLGPRRVLARRRFRKGRPSPAVRGSRRPPTGCSSTTSTPRSPSAARTSSSTAGRERPPGTPSASRRSSRSCGASATTRPFSSSRASRSGSSGRTRTPRAFSSRTPTSCRTGRTWDEFRRLEALGLTMYGQMTAGSWIYIGTQGILQGTYETFAEAARRDLSSPDGSLAGRLVVTAGLGGMGGAQPLAVDDVRRDGARRGGGRRAHRQAPRDALRRRADRRPRRGDRPCARRAGPRGKPVRSASARTRSTSSNGSSRAGSCPDVLTDQTSAHDELNGYVPHGLPYEDALRLRSADPEAYRRRAIASMGAHVTAMLELKARGAVTFDYGNNLRAGAVKAGVANAFDIVGLRPALHPPALLRGQGAVPLGGALGRSRPTSPRRTGRSSTSSRRTPRSGAGSRSRASASRFRACPRGSAGSDTASARRRASPSTSSCGRAA